MDGRFNYPLRRFPGIEPGWLEYFDRLIDVDPPELLLWDSTQFEPCAIFVTGVCDCGFGENTSEGYHWKGDVLWTDVEFLVPCGSTDHLGCGFFKWILCLETTKYHAEQPDEDDEGAGAQAWDRLLVNNACIREEDIPEIVRGWLSDWVPQLATKPIRMVSYKEQQRIWARYEEMHEQPEAEDIMRICQQRILEIESGTAKLVPINDPDSLIDDVFGVAIEEADDED